MQTPILFPIVAWVEFDQLQSAINTFEHVRIAPMKSCPRCDRPFPYGPGTGRRDTATYCSARCRGADAYEFKKGTKKRPEPIDWLAVAAWAAETNLQSDPSEIGDVILPLGDSIVATKPKF